MIKNKVLYHHLRLENEMNINDYYVEVTSDYIIIINKCVKIFSIL